jgi:hypothetical protein
MSLFAKDKFKHSKGTPLSDSSKIHFFVFFIHFSKFIFNIETIYYKTKSIIRKCVKISSTLYFSDRDELLFKKAWNAIPQHFIRGYMNSMPNICNQVIANHGQKSKGW